MDYPRVPRVPYASLSLLHFDTSFGRNQLPCTTKH